MSVTFTWRIDRPKPHFKNGTSTEIDVLDRVFPNRRVTTDDIQKLYAMHLANGNPDSLWGEIADKLKDLQGDEVEQKITLVIDTEF